MGVMPEETARVLEVEGDHALILRERSSVCQLCPDPDECTESEAEHCGIEIRAVNRAGAVVGDLVRVRVAGDRVLLAVALVYGVPLLFMGGGLYGAACLAAARGMSPLAIQGLGALGLLGALLVSFPVSRVLNSQLHRTGLFTPVIEEIRSPIEV